MLCILIVKLEYIEEKNRQLLKKLIEISTAKNKNSERKKIVLQNVHRHEILDSIRDQNQKLLKRIKHQYKIN